MRTRSSLRPRRRRRSRRRGCGRRGGRSRGAARASAVAAASTSSLVRRPSLPVPLTVRRVDAVLRAPRGAPTGDSAAGASSSSAGAGGRRRRRRRGRLPAAGCAWPRLRRAGAPRRRRRASIVAITAPTATVSPTLTACWPITPATGDGTSTATLSVSRLAIGSSASPASPGCLSHSPSVASVIDSPSVGTLTSVAMCVSSSVPALLLTFSRAADFFADVVAERVGDERGLLGWWRFSRPVAGEAAAARPA